MKPSIRLIILSILIPYMLSGQFDISVGTGSMWLDGDVDILYGLGSVNSADISIDYQLKNHFYLTGSVGYGNVKGLNQFYPLLGIDIGGGLVEGIYEDYRETRYTPYHSTNILSTSVGVSYKYYLSHDNIFVKVGFQAGLSKASTYMNLYDAENNIYQIPSLVSLGVFRPQVPIYPPSLFDDTFESKMDEAGFFYQYGPDVSIGLQLSKNGYLGIGYSFQFTSTDYLDGIAWRTAVDNSNNNDFIQKASIEYTHRFGTFHW